MPAMLRARAVFVLLAAAQLAVFAPRAAAVGPAMLVGQGRMFGGPASFAFLAVDPETMLVSLIAKDKGAGGALPDGTGALV